MNGRISASSNDQMTARHRSRERNLDRRRLLWSPQASSGGVRRLRRPAALDAPYRPVMHHRASPAVSAIRRSGTFISNGSSLQQPGAHAVARYSCYTVIEGYCRPMTAVWHSALTSNRQSDVCASQRAVYRVHGDSRKRRNPDLARGRHIHRVGRFYIQFHPLPAGTIRSLAVIKHWQVLTA